MPIAILLNKRVCHIQSFNITFKKETIQQLIYMNEKSELKLITYFPGKLRLTPTLTIYVTTNYYLQSGLRKIMKIKAVI